MKIDWFTVIAQILNFLILVWLLKRFLYGPILKAIDEREEKIRSQLNEAQAQKAEAKILQDEFEKKNHDFDLEKKELMDTTVAQVNEQRQKLMEEARNEAERLRLKFAETAKAEQLKMKTDIAQKTGKEVFAIAKKALADLASTDLDTQVAHTFAARLQAVEGEERKTLVEKFETNSDVVIVRSAFELAKQQQAEIKNAVEKILGPKTSFEFSISPELIGGIELIANGYKLSWSISEYLNDLEMKVYATVDENPKPEETIETTFNKN